MLGSVQLIQLPGFKGMGISRPFSQLNAWRVGSNFEQQSDKDKRADFSKLGLTGYSGDKVISQRDIQRLVCFSVFQCVRSAITCFTWPVGHLKPLFNIHGSLLSQFKKRRLI